MKYLCHYNSMGCLLGSYPIITDRQPEREAILDIIKYDIVSSGMEVGDSIVVEEN